MMAKYKKHSIGEEITVTDDYDGEPYTYTYEGGPVRRFRNQENRWAFYTGRVTLGQCLDLLEWLDENMFLYRDPEHPYALILLDEDDGAAQTETRAIPEHLHQLLDAVMGDPT